MRIPQPLLYLCVTASLIACGTSPGTGRLESDATDTSGTDTGTTDALGTDTITADTITPGDVQVDGGVDAQGGLRFEPARLNFGRTAPGDCTSAPVELINDADQALTVTSLLDPFGTAFTPLSPGPSAFNVALAPGARQSVLLQYCATDNRAQRAIMVGSWRFDSAPDAQLETTLPVSGNVGVPVLLTTPEDTLDFGLVTTEAPIRRTVLVSNAGDDSAPALNISSIEWADSDGSDTFEEFSLLGADNALVSLLPGESAAFEVEYIASTGERLNVAALEIASNEPARQPATLNVRAEPDIRVCPAVTIGCHTYESSDPVQTAIQVPSGTAVECRIMDRLSGESVATREWTLVGPEGGLSFGSSTAGDARFLFVPVTAGQWQVRLAFSDETGAASCADATAEVSVLRSPGGIVATLNWTASADDIDGEGDVDLHVLRRVPGACFGSTLHDCHFQSKQPDWGAQGEPNNPVFAFDSTDGREPEVFTLPDPAGDNLEFAAHGFAVFPSTPTNVAFEVLVDGAVVARQQSTISPNQLVSFGTWNPARSQFVPSLQAFDNFALCE